ncbi:hypothetical protein FDP41_003622 [Naegleria fowleri]|uniref:RRM domain-containing protein n=1 Tax=Naegleria fowleri TaxID=5763 RepID=A0A6A5BV65_NAEFO|nr:uncharacterized protein FDP41_003622 [Naegleria fowleri]KAF0977630.1 hypothetical protein FDP41_003622 [Naegleria fowleri]CAG4712451.1 unnamed protein product [Naegleria fowleri]
MKRAKQINELNQKELALGYTNTPSSWHQQEKNKTAYIYVGGLDYRLTEGDLLSVFSQYGEIVDIDLVRDENELTSKGFCFIAYEDIRSTILAIDNLNGIELGSRIICVDHAPNYYKKIVEDPADENKKDSQHGRNSRYQREQKEQLKPKLFENMEKDGIIYKRPLQSLGTISTTMEQRQSMDWTIDHDAMKKRDPNWTHKYLMQTLYEENPNYQSEEEKEEEDIKKSELSTPPGRTQEEAAGTSSGGDKTLKEKQKLSKEEKRQRKEEKKRKKEEKKEQKELKKMKRMQEEMFGGLDADI